MSSPKDGRWDRWAYERAVRDAECLSGHEKAVAHNLNQHANEQGRAWPAADTIARETGWSVRKVREARKGLEDKGWLKRFGGHSSSGCTLCHPPAQDATHLHDVQPAQDAATLHDVPPGAAGGAGRAAGRAPKQTNNKPKNNPKAASSQSDSTDPDQMDDDERVLVAFVEAGMHSAHIGQCKHLLQQCEQHGVPDAVAWLSHVIAEKATRCRSGANVLVRWIVSDIQDGAWKQWSIKRRVRLVGSRESYADRPAVEYEVDERSDEELLAAAGPERVAELVEFWRTDAEMQAAQAGQDVDEWINARVVDDLRWGQA